MIKINAETILFFDLDGTLVDTNFTNFLSYKKAIQSVTNINPNLTYNPTMRFTRNNLKDAVPNLRDAEYEIIIQEKEKCYTDFIHETKLNKEIANILLKFSKTNKTVLVTNSREERGLATLNYFEIADKFSNTFFRQFGNNNEKINKFENAIQKLDVSPDSIVAFENEETEIAFAKQAGIKIINPKIA